ncbi:transcription factor [Turnera subulata]|uniref:Transcription factor n=1 Tax=Turnera subulata TaxID=218843 RepID=A0A9Q0JJ61_9ROSI|nr:transcription factor [Turnera subulata]
MEVFSRSSREEDDEEALKWAALERLPTYDRLRRGLWISPSKHAASEIDVRSIGLEARKDLLNRLVKVAQDDNEHFLLKLRNRFDK